jgi:hypothetical protein
MPENLHTTENIKKLEKKSQNLDLQDKKDFKNQGNQPNPQNHSSDNLNTI